MEKTINTKHGIVMVTDENEYLFPNLNKETQVVFQPASGYYLATSFLKDKTLPDGKNHGPSVISKNIEDAIEAAESALDWLSHVEVEHDKTGMTFVVIDANARMILSSPDWMKSSQAITVRDAQGELNPHVTIGPDDHLTSGLREAYTGWQNRRTIKANRQ